MKAILFTVLLAFSLATSAQYTQEKQPDLRLAGEYLKKSSDRGVASTFLFIAGGLVLAVGINDDNTAMKTIGATTLAFGISINLSSISFKNKAGSELLKY